MKVVMVNDCAFVGETLLKYMKPCVERQHIKRTRGFFSKTVGLAYSILRAEGDVYHVHYLLQDCYIATQLRKKPLIGHGHGSDLRASIKRPLLGRLVRHNLRNCSKVLVSTPDVLGIAKQYRDDTEYLPNPFDAEFFFPKPATEHYGKKKVLIASDCNFNVKGTDIAIRGLSKIKDAVEVSIIKNGVDFERTCSLASTLGLSVNVLPRVEHKKLNEYFWNADVVVDRFKLGSLGVVSLEAIACGRPVITYVSPEFQEYVGFPLKNVLAERAVATAVQNADEGLWAKEHDYLTANHGTDVILGRLLEIYDSLER